MSSLRSNRPGEALLQPQPPRLSLVSRLAAVSAARFYWESDINLYNAADVSILAAVSVFPGENYQAPRSWAERAYHKLIYYNQVDQGGHYAASEQPQLFFRRGSRGLLTTQLDALRWMGGRADPS